MKEEIRVRDRALSCTPFSWPVIGLLWSVSGHSLDVKTCVFLSVKMRIHLRAAIFIFLSIALSAAEIPEENAQASAMYSPKVKGQTTSPTPTTIDPPPNPQPYTDNFLGPELCLEKSYTRSSCNRVFCPPWQRCVEGKCSCKLPYMCPKRGRMGVCGLDGRRYLSYCQVMSLSCLQKRVFMSAFGETCSPRDIRFNSSLVEDRVQVVLPAQGGNPLSVCARRWNMAAANVLCRDLKHPLGAASAGVAVPWESQGVGSRECVEVHCQGYENSLAECHLRPGQNYSRVATATCYTHIRNCRSGFFCRPGVCVSNDAVHDNIRDCLDGKDEAPHTPKGRGILITDDEDDTTVPALSAGSSSPKEVIHMDRVYLESQLHCGIPNTTAVNDGVRQRIKRVIGGTQAKPTQIQWQVAIEERYKIDCAGAFIGGCWVLTAAHCVGINPTYFRVKFSVWTKVNPQDTTDIVPVKRIIIHPRYNISTYENDIALIELELLPPYKDICVEQNSAISAVCVPWTTQLFSSPHTCSISGWGRTAAKRGSNVLLYANVTLIDDCKKFYKDRFKPGMMCAGDLEGRVDTCQGDSGGPLVCQDEMGVSYLWGIVSWGAKCGEPGFPGVYTQVAHYFEWIRYHTGWPAVNIYNS
ncbi:complement factor I isoform X2 [Gadus morhua]|uniref:complement factor I isoform X2 n=1 Tax=Gadus morhua TaxID=8049 RepID=UPI0011B36E61|nr:complement factor I isoform X2 [Gadus morhua]